MSVIVLSIIWGWCLRRRFPFHKQQTALVATVPNLKHQFVILGYSIASYAPVEI